jgi:hypothetical protein
VWRVSTGLGASYDTDEELSRRTKGVNPMARSVNRELAFSAMPYAVYSYFQQENIIDQEWELRDDLETSGAAALGRP